MTDSNEGQPVRPTTLIATFVVLATLYFIGNVIYTLLFSPLAKVPGPWINKLTRLPFIYHTQKGTTVRNTVALHAKYGPVVQLTPGDISFTSIETAWPQVYGFRTGTLKGHANHRKDLVWLGPSAFGAHNVLRADGEDHTRQRKLLSHAFSEKALLAQEDLLQGYVDQLIDVMRKSATNGECVNTVEVYNWLTFDIIGDLLFGKSFGNLENMQTSIRVQNVLRSLEALSTGYIIHHFPWVKRLGNLVISQGSQQARIEHLKWVSDQVKQRTERDTDRPDFMMHILQHNGDKGQTLSDNEINANATLIIGAGSETTATLLSGVTWLLLKNPDVMEKLKAEVRGAFTSYDEINVAAVNKMHYLQAVLSEGLRYYPPVPTGFPRVIAEGGEMVSGYYMPKGTSVFVSSYAAHHDTRNFKDPDKFDPERWLGSEKYADDKIHDMQPFSFGPHACIGRNLAYVEMRLTLAKVIWSFDMELHSSGDNWLQDNKTFTLWKKPALPVHFTEVNRT